MENVVITGNVTDAALSNGSTSAGVVVQGQITGGTTVVTGQVVVGAKGDKGDTGATGQPGTTDYNALTNKPILGTAASESASSLRDRATHTGTQAISTVSGLQTQLDNKQSGIMVNIKDYGATGDGTTDDTTAIQSAITAASASGGTVFAPQGTYLVNGTVSIPSSIKLMGSGMDNGTSVVGTTFKRTTSTGSPMFSVTGGVPESGDAVSTMPVKRVVLSDFTLRASSSTDTLLRMFYTNRNNIARVRFIGASGYAVHGVEFWDTTFDACTFDFCGSATNASVYLQNRASSTAGQMGYSNDNCNRLSFRGCTWESFTSKCIEMEGSTNGSTHLMNNITIDDCKFETSTFQNPLIQTGANVASVYIKDSYFAANAGSSPAAQILLGGSSASVKDCRFYQGASGIVDCAIKLEGHAGQNTIDSITCNWLGSAPVSGAAVVIGTPVTPSEDAVSNVKANIGIKSIGTASFNPVQALTVTADQEPKIVWDQTGTNAKQMTLGMSASGNFSFQPSANALFTFKNPAGTNFVAFDHANSRVGIGNVSPAVPLDVTGEARVSTAGTNAASVVTVGGAQTLTNKTLSGVTMADGTNVALNTTTGTKIGTATTQKIGFFNATPIAQPAATVDIATVLSNLGLRASGTAFPFTTSGQVRFTGGFGLTASTQTSAASLTVASLPIQYCNATTTAFTVTLPDISSSGYSFTIKKVDSSANVVTVKAGASGNIDGSNTYLLSTQYKYVTVTSSTSSGVWYITGNN